MLGIQIVFIEWNNIIKTVFWYGCTSFDSHTQDEIVCSAPSYNFWMI